MYIYATCVFTSVGRWMYHAAGWSPITTVSSQYAKMVSSWKRQQDIILAQQDAVNPDEVMHVSYVLVIAHVIVSCHVARV